MLLFSYRPNPRFGNQKNYPQTRQTRQYFPWGGQIPPFGGGKSDFEVCICGFIPNLKLIPNSTEMMNIPRSHILITFFISFENIT